MGRGTGLGLSTVTLFTSPTDAIFGAIAGYLSLWTVYKGFKLLTGKEGMGYGDFKLLAALGAWCGATAILPIVLISSLIGAVVGTLWLESRFMTNSRLSVARAGRSSKLSSGFWSKGAVRSFMRSQMWRWG